MKKKNKSRNLQENNNILKITYAVAAVFLCLILYFAYFLQMESEEVINNSYNARIDRLESEVFRGKILADGGEVLAETVYDENGSEVRRYPYGSLFAHAVGYTSQGKTGLESLGNFYLLSSHINLAEQVVNEVAGNKNPGDSVVTTLDVNLQKTAYDALGDRKGAIVVMEPGTGKVLAMVSKPDFDPNSLAESWEGLVSPDNKEAQLLNRSTQGLYPPGSTFKILTALEYMREHPTDWKNYHFDCNGKFSVDEYEIKCYHGNAHGSQNLEMAFANSCNGAFASLGLEIDKSRFKALTESLLFNREMPLSVPYTKSSFVMDQDASVWETLQTAIGQGGTQITPIHNAMLVSAIANGGQLMKPYFIDHVENAAGEEIKKFMPESYDRIMTAEESAALSELLRLVVTDGTASALKTDSYTAAGKTGSAEFDKNKESHAWFVGYAPAESPQIAVSILVEEGGSGGREAAPIARAIFDAWFESAQ